MKPKHFEAMMLANLLAAEHKMDYPYQVCADCRDVIHVAEGKPLDKLSASQYETYSEMGGDAAAHGLCKKCLVVKRAELAALKASRKNPKRRGRKSKPVRRGKRRGNRKSRN